MQSFFGQTAVALRPNSNSNIPCIRIFCTYTIKASSKEPISPQLQTTPYLNFPKIPPDHRKTVSPDPQFPAILFFPNRSKYHRTVARTPRLQPFASSNIPRRHPQNGTSFQPLPQVQSHPKFSSRAQTEPQLRPGRLTQFKLFPISPARTRARRTGHGVAGRAGGGSSRGRPLHSISLTAARDPPRPNPVPPARPLSPPPSPLRSLSLSSRCPCGVSSTWQSRLRVCTARRLIRQPITRVDVSRRGSARRGRVADSGAETAVITSSLK